VSPCGLPPAKYLRLVAAHSLCCSINTAVVNRNSASGLGNTPNNVGAAFNIPVETLQRVGGPDLSPMGSGETGEREQIAYFRVTTLQHADNWRDALAINWVGRPKGNPIRAVLGPRHTE
jgi:hypothetical protein